MNVFKLFFKHDQQLEGPHPSEMTLQDFMNPMSTYSSLYLTGTVHRHDGDHIFGLNQLAKFDHILNNVAEALPFGKIVTSEGSYWDLGDALKKSSLGSALLITPRDKNNDTLPRPAELTGLNLDNNSNIAQKLTLLKPYLEDHYRVVYKEPAHNGYDAHLLSAKNIYEQLFKAIQPLVDQHFRFFSANGKKLQSERHFYFDVYSLQNPPHGAEEVFPDTILYPE